ncbi:hypothetical protein E2320_013637 [Naja naja]|nr:hypothetical protein E2320_013637 [Naja naja]
MVGSLPCDAALLAWKRNETVLERALDRSFIDHVPADRKADVGKGNAPSWAEGVGMAQGFIVTTSALCRVEGGDVHLDSRMFTGTIAINGKVSLCHQNEPNPPKHLHCISALPQQEQLGFTGKDMAPTSTIYQIIKNFKERSSIVVKVASGCPRKSSKYQHQDCLLKVIQLQDWGTTSAELAHEWQQAGEDLGLHTPTKGGGEAQASTIPAETPLDKQDVSLL